MGGNGAMCLSDLAETALFIGHLHWFRGGVAI